MVRCWLSTAETCSCVYKGRYLCSKDKRLVIESRFTAYMIIGVGANLYSVICLHSQYDIVQHVTNSDHNWGYTVHSYCMLKFYDLATFIINLTFHIAIIILSPLTSNLHWCQFWHLWFDFTQFLRVTTLCGLMFWFRSFAGTCCLHLQCVWIRSP